MNVVEENADDMCRFWVCAATTATPLDVGVSLDLAGSCRRQAESAAYFVGVLSPDELQRLNALLKEDRGFTQNFVRALLLHDRLQLEMRGEGANDNERTAEFGSKKRKRAVAEMSSASTTCTAPP